MTNANAAALLIGINAYREAPLSGCVADVQADYEFLTERMGLLPKQITTYTDRDATRHNIVSGLQWLAVTGAQRVYVCFSGHGTRVPDKDGDESAAQTGTTFDQALVPVDFARNGLIIDDELADIFATFGPDTKIILKLDSCYSAKTDRSISAMVNRHLRKRNARVMPPELVPEDVFDSARTRRRVSRGTLPRRDVVLISGCRDFETSADAWFGRRIGYRGAMSFHLHKAMATLGSAATYVQVVDEMRRMLELNKFPQIPQLSGSREWLQQPIFT